MKRLAALLLLLALSAGCVDTGSALGEKIYGKGVGQEGIIDYEQGPSWLNYTDKGCAVCHGEKGQGRTVQADEVTGSAPPITYERLMEKGYTEEEIRRAIRVGRSQSGRELHYYMPRWNMTKQETDAVIRYLKSLSE